MFVSGHLGDSMDLRLFLAGGLVLSGVFCCLFGLGYFWDVHSLSFYLVVQVFHGAFQSTGWPSVVSIVGNWCGKSKRGLIMGIWNAHTSVGNILGAMIAAGCLAYGWGYAFVTLGVLMLLVGVLVYYTLVACPEDVGLTSSGEPAKDRDEDLDEEEVKGVKTAGPKQSAGFAAALKIPGVVSFSLCLFFTKLVAYTFLYWLPYYIRNTEIGGEYMSTAKSGQLSTLFDIGGVVGGILAGYISDRNNARSLTSAAFVWLSIPVLYTYHQYGHISITGNLLLMTLSGALVNGPYALITTAVSADLGTHESLKGNAKALATVTAIIDGTGSLGAALGPMLTGYISTLDGGFTNVFYMLYVADLIAGLLLMRLVVAEVKEMLRTAAGGASSEERERLTRA